MKTGRIKETKESKEMKEEQQPLLSKTSPNSKKGAYSRSNLMEKEQGLPAPLPSTSRLAARFLCKICTSRQSPRRDPA